MPVAGCNAFKGDLKYQFGLYTAYRPEPFHCIHLHPTVDFTNLIITLEQESISELAITNGQPFQSDAILAWIDWNFDGDFDDESELIYDSGPSGENVFFTPVVVPELAL